LAGYGIGGQVMPRQPLLNESYEMLCQNLPFNLAYSASEKGPQETQYVSGRQLWMRIVELSIRNALPEQGFDEVPELRAVLLALGAAQGILGQSAHQFEQMRILVCEIDVFPYDDFHVSRSAVGAVCDPFVEIGQKPSETLTVDFEIQVFLALKIDIKRAFAHASRFGDIAQQHLMEGFGSEQFRCRHQNLVFFLFIQNLHFLSPD